MGKPYRLNVWLISGTLLMEKPYKHVGELALQQVQSDISCATGASPQRQLLYVGDHPLTTEHLASARPHTPLDVQLIISPERTGRERITTPTHFEDELRPSFESVTLDED